MYQKSNIQYLSNLHFCIIAVQSYLNKRIMGGEGLLWTSSWAPKECASHHVKDPLASWMHDQTMDETFVKSASGLVRLYLVMANVVTAFRIRDYNNLPKVAPYHCC